MATGSIEGIAASGDFFPPGSEVLAAICDFRLEGIPTLTAVNCGCRFGCVAGGTMLGFGGAAVVFAAGRVGVLGVACGSDGVGIAAPGFAAEAVLSGATAGACSGTFGDCESVAWLAFAL